VSDGVAAPADLVGGPTTRSTTAYELRRRLAGRLLTDVGVGMAAWKNEQPPMARPGEVDLYGDDGPSLVLVGEDRDTARAFIGELAAQARSSVTNLAVRVSIKGLAVARRGDELATEKGIDSRGVIDHWGLTAEVRAAMTPSERARHRVGCVNQRMIILDRRAVITDGPPVRSTERSTWLVREPALVALAVRAFESSWREGRPVDEVAPPPTTLTERQRHICALLLAGQSEAGIARDIGASPRTVTYDIRAIMEALGASGRVELGYRLRQLEEHAG